MEPMAPDWRSVGGAPAPVAGREESARALPSARHVALLVGAALTTLVLGAIVALLLMPTTGGVIIDARDSGTMLAAGEGTAGGALVLDDPGRAVSDDPAPIVVDVEGAVARPGLVRVPAGGRVGDALTLAGGFAPDADLAAAAAALNLAQVVTDGLKIVVPAIGDASAASAQAPGTVDTPGSGPVDLNRATEAALDALPGVGPATIAKIVAARQEAPFRSVDELRSRGIVGEATFARLRDLVSVDR